MGNYQRLGNKTLWIFILDRIGASVILLLLAAALWFAGASGILAKVPAQAGDLSRYASLAAVGAFVLSIIVLFISVLVSWLIYMNFMFALADDALKIRKGVFSRDEVAIPYRQIQDVDIEQSLIDRFWGVARLVVLTAGHEDEAKPEGESEGILPVIDKALAEQLQTELLKRADVQRVVEAK